MGRRCRWESGTVYSESVEGNSIFVGVCTYVTIRFGRRLMGSLKNIKLCASLAGTAARPPRGFTETISPCGAPRQGVRESGGTVRSEIAFIKGNSNFPYGSPFDDVGFIDSVGEGREGGVHIIFLFSMIINPIGIVPESVTEKRADQKTIVSSSRSYDRKGIFIHSAAYAAGTEPTKTYRTLRTLISGKVRAEKRVRYSKVLEYCTTYFVHFTIGNRQNYRTLERIAFTE